MSPLCRVGPSDDNKRPDTGEGWRERQLSKEFTSWTTKYVRARQERWPPTGFDFGRFGQTEMTRTLDERFWAKVNRSGDCWLWQGGLYNNGYGCFRLSAFAGALAHRFAYQSMIGPIPEGLQLDHLCRVRQCVNPSHLEPVDCKVNILRGVSSAAVNARKTHCKNGHPFDLMNTRIAWDGGRVCRICANAYDRERRRRKRELLDAGAPEGGSAPPGDAGAQFTKQPRRTRGRGRPIRRWDHEPDDADRQS